MANRSSWTPRNIYLYAVCLITLVMVIFATVNGVRSVVELLYPQPDLFLSIPQPIDGKAGVDPQQLAQQQEAQRQAAARYSVINLVGSAAMLLLAGPLYVYHWRKIDHDTILDNPSSS